MTDNSEVTAVETDAEFFFSYSADAKCNSVVKSVNQKENSKSILESCYSYKVVCGMRYERQLQVTCLGDGCELARWGLRELSLSQSRGFAALPDKCYSNWVHMNGHYMRVRIHASIAAVFSRQISYNNKSIFTASINHLGLWYAVYPTLY